ncbi:MAG: malto-oligosyltrehalose trehalohydrolase, partial [Thermoplasmata archaeon]
MNGSWEAPTLGVLLGHGGRARIRVWAPSHRNVALRILTPAERVIPLQSEPHGYHTAEVDGIEAGATYRVQLRKNLERADPASRSQPSGVNGPSSIVDPNSFPWTDSHWSGLHLDEFVFYELHIGCFTPEGTFRSAIPELARLREIGFTAVEVMPVAEFPGGRNWGYDGVFPFSVQHTYGGPDAFKRFIDASHRAGLAVVLDVVYNHVGPEGNHFSDFGPYFSDRYRIPWGQAINFDGPGSDEVRRYFIENALRWFTEFHIDALRLDAVHAIFDGSANPFLAELGDIVHTEAKRMGSRSYFLIAESDLNDPRLLRDREEGGFGLDAQWADDFHHALHALVTQEGAGYYSDFGDWRQLSTAFERPFVYAGEHSPYRERRHGHPPTGLPRERFVVCAQNHDQVGNRARGDRLSSIVSFERWKAAVGATFLSPYLPLAFMGDEYAEHRPFPFFTDYSDPDLQQGVLRGRQQEFAEFGWPPEAIPDPQSPRTYEEAH